MKPPEIISSDRITAVKESLNTSQPFIKYPNFLGVFIMRKITVFCPTDKPPLSKCANKRGGLNSYLPLTASLIRHRHNVSNAYAKLIATEYYGVDQ